jgi:ribonuclease R
VVEVLGRADHPGVDVAVVLRHHRIPEDFAETALAAAAELPEDPEPADWRGREDLRREVVVTIDGETARDFDDAISLVELPGGGARLGVHIADVAHYVAEGGALDLEAYRRGTSVYYPERAIPMLPERLSNGLCSLRPRVPRLTLSAWLELDDDGGVRGRRFAETVIRSARRLTYGEVRRLLEEPRPGDAGEYGEVLPLLRRAAIAMAALNRRRAARGSIDFDLPEGDVILDTDGATVGIRPQERNVAHRIVEEFMIAANEAVAAELVSQECPALYRVHGAPTRERLEELRQLLRPLGLALRGDLANLHPSALREVLERAAGRPEEAFVSAVVLRTMQRALYDPECQGHYALASRYYTHFTSPIRRYPDLVVHRRLKALLNGRAQQEAEGSLLVERLPVVAAHSSATERRAEQSERDLLQWKKVRFLESQVGRRFRGRITGVQPFGLFVQLEELLVDGLVPVRSLADDYYLYEAEGHRLVGEQRGRVFQLADAVEVVLAGVDHRHRGLDLKIVDMPEPRAPRAPREPGARRRR